MNTPAARRTAARDSRRVLPLALVFAVLAVAGVSRDARAAQTLHATSSSGVYDATLTPIGVAPSVFTRYALTWQGPEFRGRATIESAIAEVRRFAVLDDGRAVVIGRKHANGVSAIDLIDLKSGKTLFVTDAYAPSLSPDGRYVAFLRIHPQHRIEGSQYVPPSLLSADYRVVDLAAGDARSPRTQPIRIPGAVSAGRTHALVGTMRWDDGSHLEFSDRYAGRVSRYDVTISDDGTPTVSPA